MTAKNKPTTPADNSQNHQQATEQFIALANSLKDDGQDLQLISAALMSASAIYATYVYAGNEGFLRDGGVDKVANIYKKQVKHIQQIKQLNAGQATS